MTITDPTPRRTERKALPEDEPANSPPEGGLKAWLAVMGAFCALFVSFGWINCKLAY